MFIAIVIFGVDSSGDLGWGFWMAIIAMLFTIAGAVTSGIQMRNSMNR